MANYLDDNLRSGDRSEYLAQYILSALGVSVLVPRTEDQGIDYYCSLHRQDGRRLTFHSPFTVQLGSVDGDKLNKTFVYGGLTKNDDPAKRNHRSWEIAFLRNQQLPFIVGTMDKKAHRLRLYSASAMWFVLHRNEEIGEIELCPEATHDPLRESMVGTLKTPSGDLPMFQVPLGPPVVDVKITDVDTPLFEQASNTLRTVIEMEQRNLMYRTLGAKTSWRPMNYHANGPIENWNYSFVPNAEVTTVGLDLLRPVLITMAMSYWQARAMEPLKRVEGMLEMTPLSDIDKQLLRDHAGINIA